MANAVAKHFLGNITHNLSMHNVSKTPQKNKLKLSFKLHKQKHFSLRHYSFTQCSEKEFFQVKYM